MAPEEAKAVLETIWDLNDKVSDAIHALSRAHFLRAVPLASSTSTAEASARATSRPPGGPGRGSQQPARHPRCARRPRGPVRVLSGEPPPLLGRPLLLLVRYACPARLGSVLDDSSEIFKAHGGQVLRLGSTDFCIA
jgi:hypothetical protein